MVRLRPKPHIGPLIYHQGDQVSSCTYYDRPQCRLLFFQVYWNLHQQVFRLNHPASS